MIPPYIATSRMLLVFVCCWSWFRREIVTTEQRIFSIISAMPTPRGVSTAGVFAAVQPTDLDGRPEQEANVSFGLFEAFRGQQLAYTATDVFVHTQLAHPPQAT